jgi:hypothetical protein
MVFAYSRILVSVSEYSVNMAGYFHRFAACDVQGQFKCKPDSFIEHY